MTNEIDLLRKTLMEYDRAKKLKQMNVELWNILMGSIYYVLKYSDKNGIYLPQKNNIYEMIDRCESRFEDINRFTTPNSTDS